MFTNILKYTAVICLTLSSVVQMSAIPQVTIVDDMKKELANCSFPPAEVLEPNSQSVLVSLCAVTEPLIKDEKQLLVQMNFAFVKFLCMELFDLSVQLCSKNISKDKYPTSEDTFEKLFLGHDITNFCERMQISSSRVKKTSQRAAITVVTLKNRTLCESHCVEQNSLNPLCGAILWASELLIESTPNEPVMNKSTSQASIAVVPPNQGHELREMKVEPANAPVMKDEAITKTDSSKIENITPRKANEIVRTLSDEVSSKGLVVNAGGLEKHVPVLKPTQLIAPTTTVTSAGAEVANQVVENDDDPEEDPVSSPRMVSGGSEDNRVSADEPINMGPKESSADNSPQEDIANDVPSRGNSPNGLPLQNQVYQDTFVDTQDSHFFAYFLTMVVICIVGYLVFHNKQKIIALALEGRRMQGSRRRPNTSSYKKLDSNLEEAVTSTCSSSSVTHVIF